MKRKVFALLSTMFLVLYPITAFARLSVITTIFPPYDFARSIAGENADVEMLLPPGAEAHDFEPTPRDIIKIQNCSLFIYIGGENDVWIEKIFNSFGKKKPRTIRLMDCVSLLDRLNSTYKENAKNYYSHLGHVHKDDYSGGGYDEHVWTSLANSMKIVSKIADEMCSLDPLNAKNFSENAETLNAELQKLDGEFSSLIASSKRRHVLFADRFPFIYFAQEYGLSYDSAFSGCSNEAEPSAAAVAFLAKRTAELELPVVFTMELSSSKMAESICEITGAKHLVLNSGHNVTRDQMERGITFLDILRANLEALRAALN